MTDHVGSGADGSTDVSRRTVLAGAAATLSGVGGIAAPAAGQDRLTIPAIIPRPDRWADENLAGFIVHLGPSLEPQDPGAVPSNCGNGDWPPDDIVVYEAALVNRKDAETPEIATNLLTGAEADFGPGQLFLINTFDECAGDDYVGIELEQIGQAVGETAAGPVAQVEEDERPDTQADGDGGGGGFGAVGPGFGALASLAGLLGGGALLRRLGDGQNDDE